MDENGIYHRCECYEKQKAEAMWQKFGIAPQDIKPLNEYKVYNSVTQKARDTAVEYVKQFSINGKWLCLMGQPGAGKTHIVVAIGKALLDKNISVVYMPYLDVTRRLKATTSDNNEYDKEMDKYLNAKVLIIDDLFKDKVKNGKLISDLGPADIKHIQPLINHRDLNKLVTLISTECMPSMLMDLDGALAGRIFKSCTKNFGVTFNKECNYRMREFMEG